MAKYKSSYSHTIPTRSQALPKGRPLLKAAIKIKTWLFDVTSRRKKILRMPIQRTNLTKRLSPACRSMFVLTIDTRTVRGANQTLRANHIERCAKRYEGTRESTRCNETGKKQCNQKCSLFSCRISSNPIKTWSMSGKGFFGFWKSNTILLAECNRGGGWFCKPQVHYWTIIPQFCVPLCIARDKNEQTVGWVLHSPCKSNPINYWWIKGTNNGNTIYDACLRYRK